MTKKPVMVSGIQPSGQLMIGNYIGAIKQWLQYQDQADCYFFLVDLHAITVLQDPSAFRERCYDFIALYLACGLDPQKNPIFIQSHVSGHAELAWVLNCHAGMGELQRMTQFKDKSKKNEQNINVGLFSYPVLMAADILLYQADQVPVGDDQKQHLELVRNLAQRFNSRYGDVFTVPEPFIPQAGARIMSLQDPASKMSKSDPNTNGYVGLLDAPDVIVKKVKKAVTDSGSEITYNVERPAIKNLIDIRRSISNESVEEIVDSCVGKGYGNFKKDLADRLVAFLSPIQQVYAKIRSDQTYLDDILKSGSTKAHVVAQQTLKSVYTVLGFIQ